MKTKILSALSILIIFLLSLTNVASFEKTNVLVNAGFEDGESNWYNWNSIEGLGSGQITSDYSYNGNNSACREICGEVTACFGQIIPVNPGNAVEASVWIMNPASEGLSGGAEAFLRIEFWEVQGEVKVPLVHGHLESTHLNKPTKWTKIEASGIVPEGVEEVRILGFVKGFNNSSKGKVYFDDFEVTLNN